MCVDCWFRLFLFVQTISDCLDYLCLCRALCTLNKTFREPTNCCKDVFLDFMELSTILV